ncbi:MAG TPA: hypothetical protein VE077_15585 [Candidatus Methylomirabilis sp.]|nr:hypothetical protein [Candidatus Methylomirabilis sp.]
MKSFHVRNTFYIAAILWIAISMKFSMTTVSAQSKPRPGDGIFTPIISPVAATDKTGRPITIEVTQPEPGFSTVMIAGKPTGDDYTINFPTSSAGGACMYTGTGRYLMESTGTLTFQMLADCGKLRRAYGYMICRLNEDLRCSEGPWWYFKDRTFAVTNQGVVINGSTVHPWKDASEAPQQLQTMAAKTKSMNDRFRNDPHVVHSRRISCRHFHPSTRSYEIHELATTCLVKSLCNGVPNVDSLRDGDAIDWNSPVGNYVKQQNKISDASDWVCWLRTQ